jgi:hypothetical protein
VRWDVFLAVIAVVCALAALKILGRAYLRWRIARWAEPQGYTLVSFRHAGLGEGPSGWRRTENRDELYVELSDKNGRRRSGWFCLGDNINPFNFQAEMIWDQ